MRPSICKYCQRKVPVEQLEVCVCAIIHAYADDGHSMIRHTKREYVQNIRGYAQITVIATRSLNCLR